MEYSLYSPSWPYNNCFVCMKHFSEVAELGNSTGRQVFDNTDAKPAILFPPATTAQWEEQVNTNNQHKEYTDATNIAIHRHTHEIFYLFCSK